MIFPSGSRPFLRSDSRDPLNKERPFIPPHFSLLKATSPTSDMVVFKDILAVDNGARFLNVDLHIHSYGASADVKDSGMTPQAIVDSALKQGLSVIAITDHNSDKNVAAAVEHARPQ